MSIWFKKVKIAPTRCLCAWSARLPLSPFYKYSCGPCVTPNFDPRPLRLRVTGDERNMNTGYGLGLFAGARSPRLGLAHSVRRA